MFRIGLRKSKVPVLELTWTPLQVILGITGLVGTGLMLGVLIAYWPQLPAEIPTHFDFSGTPDSWDSKQSLLYLAGVGVILYLVMIVLSRFPHLNNYLVAITESNAEKQYRMAVTLMLTLANVMIWMFTYIVWQTIRTALGYSEGLGEQFLYVILLVTLGPIVVYLIASLQVRDIPPRKD